MRTTGGAALGTTLGGARCLSVWVGKTCGEDMWGRHVGKTWTNGVWSLEREDERRAERTHSTET
jgi:hypothetical protein